MNKRPDATEKALANRAQTLFKDGNAQDLVSLLHTGEFQRVLSVRPSIPYWLCVSTTEECRHRVSHSTATPTSYTTAGWPNTQPGTRRPAIDPEDVMEREAQDCGWSRCLEALLPMVAMKRKLVVRLLEKATKGDVWCSRCVGAIASRARCEGEDDLCGAVEEIPLDNQSMTDQLCEVAVEMEMEINAVKNRRNGDPYEEAVKKNMERCLLETMGCLKKLSEPLPCKSMKTLLSLGGLWCCRRMFEMNGGRLHCHRGEDFCCTDLDFAVAAASSCNGGVLHWVLDCSGTDLLSLDHGGRVIEAAFKSGSDESLQTALERGHSLATVGAKAGIRHALTGALLPIDAVQRLVHILVSVGKFNVLSPTLRNGKNEPVSALKYVLSQVNYAELVKTVLTYAPSVTAEFIVLALKNVQSPMPILEMMMEKPGAQITAEAMIACVSHSSHNVLHYLISKGGNVNEPFCFTDGGVLKKQYPLKRAMETTNHYRSIELLQAGANFSLDWKPDFLALTKTYHPRTAAVWSTLLKMHPCLVTAPSDPQAKSILFLTAKRGREDLVPAILRAGLQPRKEVQKALDVVLLKCNVGLHIFDDSTDLVPCCHASLAQMLVYAGGVLPLDAPLRADFMKDFLKGLLWYQTAVILLFLCHSRCGATSIWYGLPDHLAMEIAYYLKP
ncbi:hypothetical protein Pelo_14939 [Pelomyxa schiedti]|nr:hypothetical protein Pelo_14939 [Pelomyxa schiedti]